MPPRGCPAKYFTPAREWKPAKSSLPAAGCCARWAWATASPPRRRRLTASCMRFIGISCNTAAISAIAPSSARVLAGDGGRLAECSLARAAACSTRLVQILRKCIQAGTVLQTQIAGDGNRKTRGLHPRQARPDGALFAHLVRLEIIEISKVRPARLDDDGAGRERCSIEFEPALCTHNDP